MSKVRAMQLPFITRGPLNDLLSHTASSASLCDVHDAIAIVATTGLRPGELSRLSWSCVDFAHRRITVIGLGNRNRWIPFGSVTSAVLAACRQREPDTDFVFGPVSRTAKRRFSRALRSVCVEPVRCWPSNA